jgi:hypothetical protein
MQEDPMNFNWALYEGICAGATIVLPQCNISSIPLDKDLKNISFIPFLGTDP